MKNLINKIIYSGTRGAINPHVVRRILFSNVIFLTLPIVYLAFMLLDFQVYLQPLSEMHFDQLTVPLMIIFCVIGIFLNRKGFSYLGRVAFLIIWPLLMHILPIILLQTPSDYYLAYPLGLVFHAVLIQLLISHKKESITYYTFLSISLILIVTSKKFLLHFDLDPNRVNSPIVGNEYYTLVGILYWLLSNTLIFYVINVLDGVIEKNELQRAELEETNNELQAMNDKVDHVNKSLEEQVQNRTKDLEEANKTLMNYSFYNAHLIKGPFCRIKGLVMLKEKNAIDNAEYAIRLNQSIEELQTAIGNMQDHLNEADKSKK